MDKINEFFRELKHRVSNPLFFSFLIGWLVANWKIVIGLAFYDIDQLQKDGYNSYFDLIVRTSNFYTSFLIPSITAVLYTFFVPILRNLISMFNAFIEKWGMEKTLDISKEGKISVAKYIRLREIYNERQLEVEKIIESESSYVEQNQVLINENLKLVNEKNEANKQLNNIRNLNTLKGLDGDWFISLRAKENQRVIIHNGTVFDNNDFRTGEELYKIENVSFNTYSNELLLIFIQIPGDRVFHEVFYFPFESRDIIRYRSGAEEIMEMKRQG